MTVLILVLLKWNLKEEKRCNSGTFLGISSHRKVLADLSAEGHMGCNAA
jgi:hypothetical protein